MRSASRFRNPRRSLARVLPSRAEPQIDQHVPGDAGRVSDALEADRCARDQLRDVCCGGRAGYPLLTDLVFLPVRAQPVPPALAVHRAIMLASRALAAVLLPARVPRVRVVHRALVVAGLMLVEGSGAVRAQVVHAAQAAGDHRALAVGLAADAGAHRVHSASYPCAFRISCTAALTIWGRVQTSCPQARHVACQRVSPSMTTGRIGGYESGISGPPRRRVARLRSSGR